MALSRRNEVFLFVKAVFAFALRGKRNGGVISYRIGEFILRGTMWPYMLRVSDGFPACGISNIFKEKISDEAVDPSF